ncbi:F0F1 ATP synthase subunit B [Aquihabitans sp. G128]|uniref:F0F1 ATP synthase subunit B n=1 Tax=Aquihabitans sp. G128 TaxID=2849779 RepID=UPI001C2374BA|nr:F0F1 ATP synthase subunit B [Aquihabitans sp. G128]QXC63164.1 F0F1 ATP synthase subunit B [Aquihabitans sp. G128]
MQRIRLLFAAAAILLLGFLSFPHPASAAEEEAKYKDKYTEECAHMLAEGKTLDDCQTAPNPLLPETNEIIWGVVGFAVVFGAIAWKGLPAIKGSMDARTERIRSDLDAAEAQRTEATGVLAEYQAQLTDARSQSAAIIEEARQAADEVKATLVAKAEADVAEMRTKAAADIEAAKVQAIADLRGEVANLAIGAAEEVVGANLDRDASVALVEAYIDRVGANR